MTAASTTDGIVELAGVTKTYGAASTGTVALANLDLRIDRGEYVSLMGPSGSGKTTLLNLVAGLDVQDRGRVVACGRYLGTLRDHELANMRLHTIGFVFQAFNLIPALTVEENIAWPLDYSGYSRPVTCGSHRLFLSANPK